MKVVPGNTNPGKWEDSLQGGSSRNHSLTQTNISIEEVMMTGKRQRDGRMGDCQMQVTGNFLVLGLGGNFTNNHFIFQLYN